jgi:hypothetical protein
MRVLPKRGAKRVYRFGAPFVLALFASFFLSTPLNAAEAEPLPESLLSEISALSRAGAEDLGFALLQVAQPDPQAAPESWQKWQQEKIALLRQAGRWKEIVQEYETLPAGVTDEYREKLRIQVVEAYLVMGNGAQARDLLLDMIWNGDNDAERLAQLRRLVLQSYLVEGREDNGSMAAVRYEQDYPDRDLDPQWLGLKGRLLIAEGHPNEAAVLTVVSDAPAARSVYIVARLKGLTPLDQATLNESIAWLKSKQIDQALRQSLFDALFARIRQMKRWPARIDALEAVLQGDQLEGAQVAAVVDALWYALGEYGHQIANQHQLLVGNFSPWFELADGMVKSEAQQAAALYVWLALHAQGTAIQARAHESLVALLDAQGKSWLLQPLYLSSSQFSNPTKLPLALMYRLVDMALGQGDLGLASRLMSQVDAPQGVNLVEWQLRRARVQILAGSTQQGIALLHEIAALESLSGAQIANLILAVQDLHSRGLDEAASAILTELLPKAPDDDVRRQLFFWLAELRLAQADYVAAARLYLQSALPAGVGGDDLAQLARQRAAEALEKAGFNDDAVNLYQGLLKQADSGRRELYQYHIRRLLSARR